jgi:short-subunit dehydrogenase
VAKSILITGASSGIGAALAVEYAGSGTILHLSGRDAGRLDAVARACASRGADARPTIVDVTDREACARWIAECDDSAPLDLVVANAGISAGTGGGRGIHDESHAIMLRIFDVNVGGTINTVIPAVARMRRRRRGQIAIVSSLASFVGLPGTAAYCASKAAGRIFGESLRAELANDGVGVTVVCPGFVTTPMTAGNNFRMPFLMNAEKAARIVRRGLDKNRARVAFPLPMYLLVWLAAAMPPGLISWGLRRSPRKA